MCATTLIPRPQIQDTLSEIIPAVHDAWMADADQALAPMTGPIPSFLERWTAMDYFGSLFPERFQLEQALVRELESFFIPEMKERLWMQLDRLMRLQSDLEQLTRQRSAARDVAHTVRQLLEALRLWYAELEFAAGGICRNDMSATACTLLEQMEASLSRSGAAQRDW